MRSRHVDRLLCATQAEQSYMTPLSDERGQKPFILNSKEERILQTVHDVELVTLDDIIHLLQFSKKSRNYVGAIMRKLSGGRDYDDQQFLYRQPLPIAAKGTKERVYCLGAKAWEFLAIEDAYHPAKFRHLSYSPILHDLMLSRFLTLATTYFAAQTDYKLLETRTCYQLARNPPRITVVSQRKETAITVIPDAWLHITQVRDGIEHALWIEVDRSTENIQKFKSLVRNRLALVKSRQYEKLFNTKAVLLCYVTAGTPEQTDIRLDNMLRWTEDVLPHKDVVTKEDELTPADKVRLKEREQWASLFRFATVEYEKMYDQPHRLFTEPVWYKPDEPDPVLLFAPLTHPNEQETGHGQGETGTNR
jgi:Replication-relaxation